jgi:hypothetical protein
MRTFWLYLGIFFACTGVATGLGIFLIILYFWDDLKQMIQKNQDITEKENIDPKFYDPDTTEAMR